MADGVDLGIEGLTDFQEIGSGGFATVYSAHDEGFNRRVAVKVLHSVDDDGCRRFDRERGLMGRLDDQINVVTPYRFGYTTTGSPFLVMEFLAGKSLQDLIDEHGAQPLDRAIHHLRPIVGALDRAHRLGILHRDIKPANILLTADGVSKLTDFGIAGIREATATQRAFTLAHSPPETFADTERRDERSDLYSLASTLYALVTGRGAFDSVDGSQGLGGQMNRILSKPVPATGLAGLDGFLAVAMAKDPADRFSTASEFGAALGALHTTIVAEPIAGGYGSEPDTARWSAPQTPPPAPFEPPSLAPTAPAEAVDPRWAPPISPALGQTRPAEPFQFRPPAPAAPAAARPAPHKPFQLRPPAPAPHGAPPPPQGLIRHDRVEQPPAGSAGTSRRLAGVPFVVMFTVVIGFFIGGVGGLTVAATVIAVAAGAVAEAVMWAAHADDQPVADGRRSGGIPFHQLRMRRQAKKGDWSRGS